MAAINNLFLTDKISIPNVPALIHLIYSHLIVIITIYVVSCLYQYCKLIKRSKYSTCRTSTKPIRGMMKFSSKIERWTAWLLVDLFHTPKVEKEMINEKLYLKVGDHRSWELGRKPKATGCFFVITSLIFGLYIDKLILDIFVTVTTTCIDTGDFGVPAFCYALNTIENSSNTSECSHPINCTTWNSNYELFDEEMGLLFCFSFYYNILTSTTEIVGLFGLQTFIIRVILTIVGEVRRCRRCCICLLHAITIMIPLYISIPIIILSENANLGHKKRYFEIGWKELTLTLVAMLSSMLSCWLLISTDDLHKIKNTTNVSNKRNKYQSKRFTKKGKEEQSNGETNLLLTEKSPQTDYQSVDGIHSKTTQREDTTTAELHDYTKDKDEVCTTTE